MSTYTKGAKVWINGSEYVLSYLGPTNHYWVLIEIKSGNRRTDPLLLKAYRLTKDQLLILAGDMAKSVVVEGVELQQKTYNLGDKFLAGSVPYTLVMAEGKFCLLNTNEYVVRLRFLNGMPLEATLPELQRIFRLKDLRPC